MRATHVRTVAALTASTIILASCGVKTEYLVPTPLVYTLGYEPGEHDNRYSPEIGLFFATTRSATPQDELPFGNDPAEEITFGRTLVRLGPEEWTDTEVEHATLAGELDDPPAFLLMHAEPFGVVANRMEGGGWRASEGAPDIADTLRAEVAQSPTRSLLVFVDGTKGDFYRANALAAELHHLVGRDMPTVTFSWPSHQNILSYALGSDMRRADQAGYPFAACIEWLATHSGAEHINVVGYSAGGRVAAIGLAHLRDQRPDLQGGALRDHYKISTVVFAAADEPLERFVNEVHEMHEFADRIVVTVSADDTALRLSDLFKGQGERIGHMNRAGLTPEEVQLLRTHPRVGFVDVSHGHEDRGFDIKGHHYWYRQPWVMSDVIMALRTGAPGDARGLDPETTPHLWSITHAYPERLDGAAAGVLERAPVPPSVD